MLELFLAPLVSGSPAQAQPQAAAQRVTSAYTKLDLDRCTRIEAGADHQSASWRCSGYAGVPLIVENGDDRYDIDAGMADEDEFWGSAFDYPGPNVEWRLQGNRPFAIIYRLVSSSGGQAQTSRLIVETIGGPTPGCRIASIDGRRRQANMAARLAADRLLTGPVPCMVAE